MRETRLHQYVPSHEVDSLPTTELVFPTQPRDETTPVGTWAGLADFTTAWRVQDDHTVIFENILTQKCLRLKLSAPLTCRPLFRTSGTDANKFLDVILACHSRTSILLRVRISLPRSGSAAHFSCEEVSRLLLEHSCVTCMLDLDGTVFVGFDDGSCGHLRFSEGPIPAIDVTRFAPRAIVNMDQRRHGENTSLVSGMSEESMSHRSVASSMSFGLMNRLFGTTPRASGSVMSAGAMEATSQTLTQSPGFLRRREERYLKKEVKDSVLDIARVGTDGMVLASLHCSGRICVYVETDGDMRFGADIVLPVELSKGMVNHFLLSGPTESVLAVVMADEDPNADSLRLFNVTTKLRGDRSVSLALTQIAQRDGPVDRIVAACFTGNDVIVASDTGFLSGVLNTPNSVDSNVGIPSGTLWTALDDVDESFGLGMVLDTLASQPWDPLLQAHRFSSSAIAKALRLTNPAQWTRHMIEDSVKATVFENDPKNMWRRVKARAEQVFKSEDLLVRDISLVKGVGIVVARMGSLFVLRALLESEKKAMGGATNLSSSKEPVSNLVIACLLASHASCQVVASQYATEGSEGQLKSRLKYMLMMATSFSRVATEMPLTDRMAFQEVKAPPALSSTDDLLQLAVLRSITTLEPGPALLSFLNKTSEMNQLLLAAEQVADKFPVSAMFASGLSWISRIREDAGHSLPNSDEAMQNSGIAEGESTETLVRIERGYACLVSSANWCDKDVELGEDDVQCVLDLAGLSHHDINRTKGDCAEEDVIMVGISKGLPNGPKDGHIREHLGFWLLERSVRLLEKNGAPKSAAAVALEAMSRAPDRQRHEMMRAAAFSTFLDAGELEHALTAILRQPFGAGDSPRIVTEESDALRDAIGLFVDAAADRGKLQWLASCKLPEPLHVLCGLALERRARAADSMLFEQPSLRRRFEDSFASLGGERGQKHKKAVEPYEQLYLWYVLRGDEASAATSALEWGERLSNEGLAAIRDFISGSGMHLGTEEQIRLVLSWARLKSKAYSYASSAAQLETVQRQYIARSRFSIQAARGRKHIKGLVSLSWVSRRHLLVYAQSRVLADMLSLHESDANLAQTIPYLTSRNSNLLAEETEGIIWIISMLTAKASYDNLLLSAELGSAWRQEAGGGILVQVVKRAAELAAQKSISSFGYTELDELLRAVVSTNGEFERSKNWNLVALESALSSTAGTASSPQWLMDAAAWGTPAFAEGTAEHKQHFSGRTGGDAAGVVRTLLRNNRPFDAARVLLVGLANQEKMLKAEGANARLYVPYSAIDATIDQLADAEGDYADAKIYRERLENSTKAHLLAMDSLKDRSDEAMEVTTI